jgi:hypothetical protein
MYIVTIKLPRNPAHDPRAKRGGECLASALCTDVTGEHHSVLVDAVDIADALAQIERARPRTHITRVEYATPLTSTLLATIDAHVEEVAGDA